MKIVTLQEYKDEFLDHCKEFYKLNDRNKEWFNPSNPGSIPNSYTKYPLWTFLLDDNNDLISLSCVQTCLLYTSPSPRDGLLSRMPSSA